MYLTDRASGHPIDGRLPVSNSLAAGSLSALSRDQLAAVGQSRSSAIRQSTWLRGYGSRGNSSDKHDPRESSRLLILRYRRNPRFLRYCMNWEPGRTLAPCRSLARVQAIQMSWRSASTTSSNSASSAISSRPCFNGNSASSRATTPPPSSSPFAKCTMPFWTVPRAGRMKIVAGEQPCSRDRITGPIDHAACKISVACRAPGSGHGRRSSAAGSPGDTRRRAIRCARTLSGFRRRRGNRSSAW